MWRKRRWGGVYRQSVREFKERETFTAKQWEQYQTECLRRLLRHAAAQVPYYRELFKKAGLNTGELEAFRLEDLARIPPLEKEVLRLQSRRLIADRTPKLHTYLSSGTTGTPMALRFSSAMHQRWSAAYETRCRQWSGVDDTMSRAMIGGRLVVPKADSKPPFWRYNFAEKQLYFSAFHISPANTPAYVEALNRFKPDYLVGYASAHFFLARMIAEQKLRVHRPKAVLTSSEKLTDEMRRVLESVYQCPVFDAYSGVEACCLASECPKHRLHVSPDVGIIELLNDKQKSVGPGEIGEIVATGLLNFDQPLIRYRTGDHALWSDEKCPCGRAMPVLKELVGRLEDTVVGPDGRETVRFHGIFVGIPKIREGQIIQETLRSLRVRLAADSRLDENETSLIQKRFNERLGPVHLDIEYVDVIERTDGGKFRAVISKVSRKS